MPFRQLRHTMRPVRPSGVTRFAVGAIKLLIVLALIAVAGWFYFQHEFTSQLAQRIEEKVNQQLSLHGLHADLGQARLVEGEGIWLNNLKLGVSSFQGDSTLRGGRSSAGLLEHINRRVAMASGDGIAGEPIAELYDAFVHLPVGITDVLLGNVQPLGFDVRRAKLNIVRDAAGKWQLERFIEAFKPKPGAKRLPIRIHDSEIRIVDQTHSPPLVHRLTDVQVQFQPLEHQGRRMTRVVLRCVSNEIGSFDVTVDYDDESRSFDLQSMATNIRLSPALFGMLPEAISDKLKTVRTLTGELDLEAHVAGNLGGDMPQFMLVGSLKEFALDDTRLALPITRASTEFLISNDEINFKRFRGRLGEGGFEVNYQQAGFLQRRQWQASGKVTHLAVEYADQLSDLFSKGCKQFCHDFSPEGEFDIAFDLSHDGQKLSRKIHADLRDMAFRFIRFPYRITGCSGTVDWLGDEMTIKVKSGSTQKPIVISGTIVKPGPGATYDIFLDVNGSLPIDQKMMTAVDAIPALSRVIRPFNPIGRVAGVGKLTKRIPFGEVDKFFDINLKGVTIRHNSFPYPIEDIAGMIKARNLDFIFEKLTGENGNATVLCNGSWNVRNGLDTHFVCQNVAMDDQLKRSLSSDLQDIWSGFRPRGTVSQMEVGMTMPVGQPSPAVVVGAKLRNQEQQLSNVSIFPTWFPYEIHQMTGDIKIGNGRIEVSKISGKHDRSTLSCKGGGNYSAESWMVKLEELLATSIKVDDDLLTALPTYLAPPIRQMKYEGLMNVRGEMTVAGFLDSTMTQDFNDGNVPQNAPAPGYLAANATMAWDLNFAMNNAKVLVGLPIENVFGEVNLTGTYDGRRAECKGELNLDSLTIYEAQITNVRGPIWLDNDRVAAGVLADPAIAASATNNRSPLANARQSKRSVTGDIYGGIAKIDAEMANDRRGRFYIQSTLADGDIRQAAADFAPSVEDVEGHGFVAMRVGGEFSNPHSYKGDGTIQLRDAKIYKLPKMLTLLKMLNVGRTDRTAFDSSNVNFLINGTDIDFERIELVGDAISLIGNGTVNLEQEQDIALNFYSIVGRNRIRIPVLSELYHAGSQRILWITVDGTVDNPKMSRQVLPQLNDSIRQLFQPVESRSPLLNRDAISRTANNPLDTQLNYRR